MESSYIRLDEIRELKSAEGLARIRHKYDSIRSDFEYNFYYKIFGEFYNLSKKVKRNKRNIEFSQALDMATRSLKSTLETKWHLKYPINPALEPKWDNLLKNRVTHGSSLARILYGLGTLQQKPPYLLPELIRKPIIGFALYPSGKPKKITVTKDTLLMTKKHQKLLVSMLSGIDISHRHLGLIFNLHKDTIKNWVKEVKEWPEYERRVVSQELFTSRRRIDTDIHDLSSSMRNDKPSEFSIDPRNSDWYNKPISEI